METLTLYGFGFTDRSAKIRWLAHELDVPVKEVKVKFGEQKTPDYKTLNPFGVVPTAIWKGVTLRESGAMCLYLAEQFPESGMIVGGVGQQHADFQYWSSIGNNYLEHDVVNYLLARSGILNKDFERLTKSSLEIKLKTLTAFVPLNGYWMGEQFTLVDIFMGYLLQLAVKAELVAYQSVKPYLSLLMSRPAAQSAMVFAKLDVPT